MTRLLRHLACPTCLRLGRTLWQALLCRRWRYWTALSWRGAHAGEPEGVV